MKVRMLISAGGPFISLEAGDLFECDDAEAARMIEAGSAEAVSEGDIDPKMIKAAEARAAAVAANEAAEREAAEKAAADAAAIEAEREAKAELDAQAAAERAAEKEERLAAAEARELDLAQDETAVDPQLGKETRSGRAGRARQG